MTTLRARIPFKADDEDLASRAIPDEQEQEHIIESIRHETQASTKLYLLLSRILLALSAITQITFFLSGSHVPTWIILFNLLFHANAFIAVTPTFQEPLSTPLGPIPSIRSIPILYCIGSASLTTLLALYQGQGVMHILQSSETMAILLTILIIQNSLKESEVDLIKLDALRFPAKGA